MIKGIDKAIKTLEKYDLKKYADRLCRIMDRNMYPIAKRDEAEDDVWVGTVFDRGYHIHAFGEAVGFREFGSGIWANGDNENAKKLGISADPGSWSQTEGKGHFIPGVKENWMYNDEVYEYTPPYMGMTLALDKFYQDIDKWVKEAFSSPSGALSNL